MPKYLKIFNQFSEFVQSAAKLMQDPYERKLVNIILDHFDQIADAGTGYGKRAGIINSLIQTVGKSASDVLPVFEDKTKSRNFPFKSLVSMEVEDFRGFTRKETINFDKNYTFIYGPNGSGKSSFCEALEYALLGYIDEAINRRIDADYYIRNSFTGRSRKPNLTGLGVDGKSLSVQPDSALYHFCFVEKNRIEDFGRISANTQSDKRNLLSALFGIADFNNFVGEFTKNIEKYIDTVGQARLELANKSAGIKVHQENIKKAKERLVTLEMEKKELANTSGIGINFDKLDEFIRGVDGKDGRLVEIDKLLLAQPPTRISIATIGDIDKQLAELEACAYHTKALYEEFDRNRDKVQFRSLYVAAVNLEALVIDKCPVCETPVQKTSKHPYEHAREKLKELEQIANLETELSKSGVLLHSKLTSFVDALNVRKQAADLVGYELQIPELEPIHIENLPAETTHLVAVYEGLLRQWDSKKDANIHLDQLITEYNEETQKLLIERDRLDEERRKLSELSKAIEQIRAKWDAEEQNLKVWEAEVGEFMEKNVSLIDRADKEKGVVEENTKYVTAYKSILEKITRYNDLLPLQNLEELNALTTHLYNLINEGDREFEKLARIELPTTTDDAIHIIFSDRPDREIDALQVLSEGHVRCLGLSILLAKNIHENCPIIIFDDVVNAIDDDHRGGVRKVIFTDDFMGNKQVILTTHAEQFVKELEQHVSKSDYDKLVNKILFQLDSQDRLIRIKLDAQQNYLSRVERGCGAAQWSEALYYSRCCLESLCHKLWKKLSRSNLRTEFSVVIRTPDGVPDLMSVVELMNKFLRKIDASDAYEKINKILDDFLGLKTRNNIIWQYLNKGTHEEEGRVEFDPAIVKEIYCMLLDLDHLVKHRG